MIKYNTKLMALLKNILLSMASIYEVIKMLRELDYYNFHYHYKLGQLDKGKRQNTHD